MRVLYLPLLLLASCRPMPPRFIRVVATISIGLPGLALWLGGLVVIGCVVALLSSTDTAHMDDVVIISVGGLLSTIAGSVMLKGWQLFIQGNRHQLTIPRISIITVIAISAQVLAVIALCCLIPGIFQVFEEGPREGLIPLATSVASLAASIYLHRLGFDLRLKWEQERSATRRFWQAAAQSAASSETPPLL